ncbi:hypothetical protein EVJ32_04800 [Exiguobacterium sp. SH5S4]|uniref:hypothetical protein n=1 Tax=Exiguobacterium sp. SH5S4 TaxID=2510961 RepID=UPI0010388321|nr:hypothetical protein [Exiguobacterium sp. SH5S4]TCI26696.1 hypothetical protein EVJ32_04800 [Exiguobacterium sp. SH5S4]
MDLSKFEKIDGREALRRLVEGLEIFTNKGTELRLNFKHSQVVNGNSEIVSLYYPVNVILSGDWYIPKPFDVRQAMRDKPDEWVGAFENGQDNWIQVGFDAISMAPATAYHGYTGKVIVNEDNPNIPTRSTLDSCIPIEDVPAAR